MPDAIQHSHLSSGTQLRRLVLAIALLALCSTPFAAEREATIVFMRSSAVGAAVAATIYEITDDETIFIGIIKNKTKINYATSTGKHTFMVVSEAADFMEADVAAGHTYYAMVTPRTGAWKARFSLIPIRNGGATDFSTDSKKFEKWKSKTKLVTTDDSARAWYEAHKDSVDEKRAKYWEKWQQKSAAELSERTLLASDGT